MGGTTAARTKGGRGWWRMAYRMVAVPFLVASGACGGSSPVVSDPFGGGGGGSNVGAGPAPTNAVSVRDHAFEPARVSVPRGDVVVWTWNGRAEHNVTWVEPGLVDSPTQADGTHEARMPAVAGEFGYYCTIHGSPSAGMRGAVVVQ